MFSFLLEVTALPHQVPCVMSSDTPYSRYQILGRRCLPGSTHLTRKWLLVGTLDPILRDEILLKQSYLHSIALRQKPGSLAAMYGLHVGRLKDDMYAPM